MISKVQAILSVQPERAAFFRDLPAAASPPDSEKTSCGPASSLFSATIQSLLRTLAARDPYTAHHSVRVTKLATCFAVYLGLGSQEIATLHNAVILHDLGKIGISDAILNKPGPLTPEERAIITTHPLIGELIVEPLNLTPGERDIILLHHERWDGTGYPRGIAGTEIPFLCRLTSLADAYDAMITDRPYRRGFPAAQALKEIESQAGSLYDPELTGKFAAFLRSSWQKISCGSPLSCQAVLFSSPGRFPTRTSASPHA